MGRAHRSRDQSSSVRLPTSSHLLVSPANPRSTRIRPGGRRIDFTAEPLLIRAAPSSPTTQVTLVNIGSEHHTSNEDDQQRPLYIQSGQGRSLHGDGHCAGICKDHPKERDCSRWHSAGRRHSSQARARRRKQSKYQPHHRSCKRKTPQLAR